MSADDFTDYVSRTKGRDATQGVIPGQFALSVGMPDLPGPTGWRWVSLNDVARLESGHTPSRKHPEYWNGGIPWIGIKDAVDNHGRTITDTYQHVSALGLENSSARLLPARTVCLSRTASVGYVVMMGQTMATSQDFVNWVCGPELRPEFLKYILVAERQSYARFSSGSTHQTIYYPEAKAFHVLLPPRREQDGISGILGALDEKIELNQKTNETVEAMTRALFKSWFIDFDPVRVKMGLPGPAINDDVTGGLFPASMQGSSAGEIPSGWRLAPLSQLVELQRGHDLPHSARLPGLVPVVSSSGVTGSHVEARAAGPGIVTGRYGTIGKVFLINGDYWPLNTTLYSKNLHDNDPFFVYYALLGVDFGKYSDKAAVPGINRNHLHLEPVILPPVNIQQAFGVQARGYRRATDRAENETRTLTRLRDTLLPKLLSGELRIPDAERLVTDIL